MGNNEEKGKKNEKERGGKIRKKDRQETQGVGARKASAKQVVRHGF